MSGQADIAVVGIGVMGSNLALNMAEKGATVALYDLDSAKAQALADGNFPGKLIPCMSLSDLVACTRTPRPIVLLAPAGDAVEGLIDSLTPVIESGDIVIDAGNSAFADTQRRTAEAEARGTAFLGIGVSGGAEGARRGPAMMAGGSKGVWDRVAPIFSKIAAQHKGTACAAWLGPDGAGHFVKTAHNGIEYALMQMIAECYGILRDGFGMSAPEIGAVFAEWNKGALDCYLIDITAKALKAVDADTGLPMVDVILDRAGQKGTGLWTAVTAQHLGAPVTTVEAALIARNLSSRREARRGLEGVYGATPRRIADEGLSPKVMLREALIAGKIIAFSQGFALIKAASDAYRWDVNMAEVAEVWRAGCIIRSRLLDEMSKALSFERITAPAGDAPMPLLSKEPFVGLLQDTDAAFRGTVATAAVYGLPAPALSAALAWFDLARTGRSTANMIQAQRDYFGAHGFERTDRPGSCFHGEWRA